MGAILEAITTPQRTNLSATMPCFNKTKGLTEAAQDKTPVSLEGAVTPYAFQPYQAGEIVQRRAARTQTSKIQSHCQQNKCNHFRTTQLCF